MLRGVAGFYGSPEHGLEWAVACTTEQCVHVPEPAQSGRFSRLSLLARYSLLT